MRETPLSNCERQFILKAISERKRLDGRDVYDYRKMRLTFGVDRGCCQVELGKTRVLTQVSCEVTAPKQTRPTEGIMFVNVELSPMAAPHFEAGRMSEYGVEINRLLERCLKESHCLDTESLCIMAGVKVWTIRVDCHVLNYEGNIMDCCSVSAIAALAHFRRPDVSVSGEDVTIHTLEERDPIPLSVHHMPICITFAFFDQGKYLLVDPSLKEEKVMDGKMVIGMNKHREICTLQMTGSMLLVKDQVLRCSNIAVVKVTEITELIQRALQADTHARSTGGQFGFSVAIETKKVTASEREGGPLNLEGLEEEADDIVKNGEESWSEGDSSEGDANEDGSSPVKILAPGTGQIGDGGTSTWTVSSDDQGEDDDEEEMDESVQEIAPPRKTHIGAKKGVKTAEPIELSGDSEEEDVVMLGSDDLDLHSNKPHKKHMPFGGDSGTLDLSSALKTPSQTKSPKSNKGSNPRRKKKGSWLNV